MFVWGTLFLRAWCSGVSVRVLFWNWVGIKYVNFLLLNSEKEISFIYQRWKQMLLASHAKLISCSEWSTNQFIPPNSPLNNEAWELKNEMVTWKINGQAVFEFQFPFEVKHVDFCIIISSKCCRCGAQLHWENAFPRWLQLVARCLETVESWVLAADGLTALPQPWSKLMAGGDLSLLPAGVHGSPDSAPFGTIWNPAARVPYLGSSSGCHSFLSVQILCGD